MKRTILLSALFVITAASVYAEGTEAATDSTVAADTPMRGGYLFSLRPEFTTVHGDISSVGAVAEVGKLFENGLFLSLDLSGGANYFGGGFNTGYFFLSRDAIMRGVIGYSLGYYNTEIVVKFESESGKLLKRFVGHNAGVTGLFFKITGGDKNNVDITGRVMTGYKSGSVWYNETDGIYKENDFTASYSISLGYTLFRRDGK